MRRCLPLVCLFSVLTMLSAGFAQAQDEPNQESDAVAYTTDSEKMSYAIGAQLGTRFKSDGITLDHIDVNILAKGISDVLGNKDLALDNAGIAEAMMALQQVVSQGMLQAASTNKEKGVKFLEENKSKEGVQVTASGLQYIVIKEGEGDAPSATSTVKVNYEGKLLDGTTFDSSYERGTPAEFGLNQVIAGWTEGLQLMKPGAQFRFFIPSELAYGDRGMQGAIPPNSTLIFEVELLEVL